MPPSSAVGRCVARDLLLALRPFGSHEGSSQQIFPCLVCLVASCAASYAGLALLVHPGVNLLLHAEMDAFASFISSQAPTDQDVMNYLDKMASFGVLPEAS
ncbi:hypothetical protein ISCGN_022788 [Ixodes scapularis]